MVTLAVLVMLRTVLVMKPEYECNLTKVVFNVLRAAFAREANSQVESVLDILADSFCFSSEVRVGG